MSDPAREQQVPQWTPYIVLILILLSLGSLFLDLFAFAPTNWFQRSGALLILAGIQLQFSKLVGTWRAAIAKEEPALTVDERLARGMKVSMHGEADQSARTRNFALELHRLLTARSKEDIGALALILIGTVVSSYGDIPFR